MEWYLILVTGFFSFPTAVTVILQGPTSSVYPEGNNVTLQCIAESSNRIVWEDINDNTVIFIDKEKNTRREKFDNFIISNDEDNFSLTIVNAQLSDEGLYSCEEGDDSRRANVTIEARPDLSIFVNNTALLPKSNITITEDEQVPVVCIAERAKPAVHLKLKFGNSEWIKVYNSTTDDGVRFTTETRVVHRFTRADSTVTCQATGQVSIPPSTTMISINVLHKPTCVIKLETNRAECHCLSNPAVTTYSWFINGELQSIDSSLHIHEYIPANITCLASNKIGTSPSTSQYVSTKDLQSDALSTNVVIIIAVIVACVIIIGVFLIIVLYRRSKHASEKLPCNEEGPNEAETRAGGKAIDESQDVENIDEHTALNHSSEETSDDTKEPPKEDEEKTVPLELEQEDEEVKIDPGVTQLIPAIIAVISHDWEIFAIEDLNLKPEIVKEIIREHPKVADQLSAALNQWGTSCPKATKSYLEKQILTKSDVYGYYMEYPQPRPRGGDNNGRSDEQFPKVATFSELLKEVVKCVGNIGAHRVSLKYKDLDVDAFTKTLTGESIIALQQKENVLTDDMDSLRRLKKALDDSFLFRASNLVDTYINAKEKLEANESEETAV